MLQYQKFNWIQRCTTITTISFTLHSILFNILYFVFSFHLVFFFALFLNFFVLYLRLCYFFPRSLLITYLKDRTCLFHHAHFLLTWGLVVKVAWDLRPTVRPSQASRRYSSHACSTSPEPGMLWLVALGLTWNVDGKCHIYFINMGSALSFLELDHMMYEFYTSP